MLDTEKIRQLKREIIEAEDAVTAAREVIYQAQIRRNAAVAAFIQERDSLLNRYELRLPMEVRSGALETRRIP